MFVLGVNGGVETVTQSAYPDAADPGETIWTHDASAALLDDGRIVAALENERPTRIKHCPKVPGAAVEYCLRAAGIRLQDLAAIGFYSANVPRHFIASSIRTLFGVEYPAERVHPIEHHLAHATSAFAWSGFDESLVVTVDFIGDGLSGTVGVQHGSSYERLRNYSYPNESPGVFYSLFTMNALGFGPHAEYKVMGLAPYGNPERYQKVFEDFYELGPKGGVKIFPDKFNALATHVKPRIPKQPFTQEHKDVAATVQLIFEKMLFHILESFQKETGLRNLSLAGGCGQNSTANGRILRSGLFDDMFVQPASYDAGTALGSAMQAFLRVSGQGTKRFSVLKDVRLGPAIETGEALQKKLENWGALIESSRYDDIADEAARRLASGRVIGWVQGRSEFGARALGGRSILADPRPAENKSRINALVKKREAYRPFAPSVLDELASDFFDVGSSTKRFAFMTYVVPVKPDKRSLLGAITHVDGTARIQTVDREISPEYWAVIERFRERTGIPMVLNTSFNNDVEPIVDSVEDALECFLTTGLDAVVIGSYLVERKGELREGVGGMSIALLPHVSLTTEPYKNIGWPEDKRFFGLKSTGWQAWGHGNCVSVSESTFRILELSQNGSTVDALKCSREQIAEIIALWERRWIRLRPPAKLV